MPWSSFFECWVLSQLFHSPLHLIKRLFSSLLSAIRVVSSAYLRLLILLPAILIPACASSSPASCMMYSANKLNKQGDNIQPWHTPFPIWKQSVVPCPVLTVASWSTYRFLRRQVKWSGIPISWRIFHSLLWSTVNGFGVVNKTEVDVFLELSYFFDAPNGCLQFDLWFLCFFLTQAELLAVHISGTVEDWLGDFWALLC